MTTNAEMIKPGMKIFFVVSHSSAGGAQEIWVNLAQQFLAKGAEVLLLALYPLRADVRATPAELPWSYVVPKRPNGMVGTLGLLKSLTDFVRKEKPSFIFTAMPAANIITPVAVKLSGTSAKVILSHHSPADTHSRMLNRIDGLTGSFGNVKHIVGVSNTVLGSLDDKPKSYRLKSRTIYNALPPGVECQLEELRACHSPRVSRHRRVVATGRLAPQKNYPVLLRAAAHMPDVCIDIVGTGPDETMLKTLAAELGVANRVRFLGHRPREEALKILADADLFVQPSLFEGHSLALIEAAKVGLPLVVSNIAVQMESITLPDKGICGIAVDAADDAALAREILKLLDDPTYYSKWAEASATLASAISFQKMIASYQELMC
jgi:glycosyltransferase involved in cell wall biosynthesis